MTMVPFCGETERRSASGFRSLASDRRHTLRHGLSTQCPDINIRPQIALPFSVIKGLAQQQRDEPFGLNMTESFAQRSDTVRSEFCICNHFANSNANWIGVSALISLTLDNFFSNRSSVVTKTSQRPAIAHAT